MRMTGHRAHRPAPYVLAELTNHWKIVGARHLRVATVRRRADGALLRVLVDEDANRVVGAA